MTTLELAADGIEIPGAFKWIERLLSPGPVFNLYSERDMGRRQVERYVSSQFHTTYEASIRDFMPLFLTMRCQGGLSAVAGIRFANKQSLFLEQYLHGPIEEKISQIASRPVNRGQVAEIGNLAATRVGSSYLLFLMLAATLQQTEFEWLVFSATPQVQKSLKRLDMPLYMLGDADPALLKTSSLSDWGSYYKNHPRVMAGRLSDAIAVLEQRKICSSILSLFQARIKVLAQRIDSQSLLNG